MGNNTDVDQPYHAADPGNRNSFFIFYFIQSLNLLYRVPLFESVLLRQEIRGFIRT